MYDPSFDREDQTNSVSLTEAKIFVAGLPLSLTEEELCSEFGKYGQVIDSLIMTEKESKKSKGCGFVYFATKLEARKVASIKVVEIKGRKVKNCLKNHYRLKYNWQLQINKFLKSLEKETGMELKTILLEWRHLMI